jgi:hypothetical protein
MNDLGNLTLKVTPYSKNLISFFYNTKCIIDVKQTKKTNQIFHYWIEQIKDAFTVVKSLPITPHLTHIRNPSQIPKPKHLTMDDISTINNYIDAHSVYLLQYSLPFIDRNIHIHFIVESSRVNQNKYNKYVKYMLVWLYIASHHASNFCFDEINIYIYHTSLIKTIPENNRDILGQSNVNTAFTTTCPTKSELIVYRQEEWFKVFIHETMHNFALDFSDMSMTECHAKILHLFQVNSEVNLFEAYTEFWARIINILFFSYSNSKSDTDILTNVEQFMKIERTYSCFQMNKVLNFMGLEYNQLYDKNIGSQQLRNEKYKETSNVLSYYIITGILIYNYQDFLLWCYDNNAKSMLQFKKTQQNLQKICQFIGTHYKSRNMVSNLKCCNQLLSSLNGTNNKEYKNIIRNLRMTICELG